MDESFGPQTAVVATTEQLSAHLGTEVVVLSLRDSVYYGLEDAGARIWDLLQTRRTIAEIVDILTAEFEVSAEVAEADLRALLADLETRGLVAVIAPDRS